MEVDRFRSPTKGSGLVYLLAFAEAGRVERFCEFLVQAVDTNDSQS